MKKAILIPVLFLSVSAAQSEQTIDALISSANSIQTSIDSGKTIVYGLNAYASVGGIAPDGTVNSGLISQAQIDAYNSALSDIQNANYYDAQTFFDDQYSQSMTQLATAIDTFADAAVQIETVIAVADIAAEADTVTEQQSLQTYIGANDVELTQADVSNYNTSLTDVQTYAQAAAAFKAASGDAQVKSIADDAATNFNESLYTATAAYSAANDHLTIMFQSGSMGMIGFFSDDFKTIAEVMGAGQTIYDDQGWIY